MLSVPHLPPALPPVRSESGDDVLDVMAGAIQRVGIVRPSRVTDEALVVLVLEVTDDTEALRVNKTASRRGRQVALSTNQQVPGGRVTAALLTRARWSPRSASISQSPTFNF